MATDASFSAADAEAFRGSLIQWYRANRRKLPWRGDLPPYGSTTGPAKSASTARSRQKAPAVAAAEAETTAPPATMSAYGAWVSEIMLQQTRVETVIPYWLKWMQRYPTVTLLAAASEADVFALWSGLGYYRRASNLLKGAKYVAEKHGGELPLDVKLLKEVPGIGDYTAGAIASIAGGRVAPLVDGNVVRVFSRMRRIGLPAKAPALNKACWRIAADVVCPSSPADFNSGLMELGATLCTPRSPACGACPMRAAGLCLAFDEAAQLLRAKGLPALQVALEGEGAEDAENGAAAAAAVDDDIIAIDGEASSDAAARATVVAAPSPSASSGTKKAVDAKAGAASASKGKPSKSSSQPSLLGFFSSSSVKKGKDIDKSKATAELPAAVSAATANEGKDAATSAAAAGGAGAGASTSSAAASSSSAVPDSGFSVAELAAIGKYIEGRWPAPAAKKAVPTLEITAVVPVRQGALSSEAAIAGGLEPGAGPDELLVWLSKGALAPPTSAGTDAVAKPDSAAAASSASSEAIEIVSDDDNGAAAAEKGSAAANGVAAAAVSSGSSRKASKPAAKRPRAPKATATAASASSAAEGAASPAHVLAGALLKGQWQPLLLRTEALLDSALAMPVPAGSAGKAKGKGSITAKRPRKAAEDEEDGSDSDADDGDHHDGKNAAAVAPRLDVTSPRVAAAVSGALIAAGLMPAASATASAAASTAHAEMEPVRLRHCGTVTHVFSHVIHRLQVLRVDLDTTDTKGVGAGGSSSGAAGGAASMPGAASAARMAAEPDSDAARWVSVSELPAIGVTTWAAKILYAALLGLGKAGSEPSSGTGAGGAAASSSAVSSKSADSASLSGAAMSEGLQLLAKRWKIAHGKIE